MNFNFFMCVAGNTKRTNPFNIKNSKFDFSKKEANNKASPSVFNNTSFAANFLSDQGQELEQKQKQINLNDRFNASFDNKKNNNDTLKNCSASPRDKYFSEDNKENSSIQSNENKNRNDSINNIENSNYHSDLVKHMKNNAIENSPGALATANASIIEHYKEEEQLGYQFKENESDIRPSQLGFSQFNIMSQKTECNSFITERKPNNTDKTLSKANFINFTKKSFKLEEDLEDSLFQYQNNLKVNQIKAKNSGINITTDRAKIKHFHNPFEKNLGNNNFTATTVNKDNNHNNRINYLSKANININSEAINLNLEIGKISKNVKNFKIKEETPTEYSKKNERIETNNCKTNIDFQVPFGADLKNTGQVIKDIDPNNKLKKDQIAAPSFYNIRKKYPSNLNSNLLLLKDLDKRNDENTINNKSKAEPKPDDDKRNINEFTSIPNNNTNYNYEDNNRENYNLASYQKDSILNSNSTVDSEFRLNNRPDTFLKGSYFNEKLLSKNKLVTPEIDNKTFQSSGADANDLADGNKDTCNTNKPNKILKIKAPKPIYNTSANEVKLHKEKSNADNKSILKMNILKRKKEITCTSVKKLNKDENDFCLDIEEARKKFLKEAKNYSKEELGNFILEQKNILEGKAKAMSARTKYFGHFKQINGNKIESSKVFRDNDINFPQDLQNKIHINDNPVNFDDDASSTDELVLISRNYQLNKVKSNMTVQLNDSLFNNLKYSKNVYWDDY